MKIGVDAYYLHAKHIDGLGTYLLRLMKELSRIDAANDYYLYTPGVCQETYAAEIFRNRRFHLRIVPGLFKTSRRLWLQSPSLKRGICGDGVELFFAGAEYFPLLLPRSITVALAIHDVAFRAMPAAISLSNMLFYRLLFPLFIRRADRFFTVSHHSRDEMTRYLGIRKELITVIHNGIDLDTFSPASPEEKKDYILFVGTLQPRKNLVNLVRAFERASGSIPHRLVVVGASGWKNSPLRNIIENLSPAIRKRIEIMGYIAGPVLVKLYREAALFALPSFHEGFCLPIMESLASGTPALSSPVTAIPEIYGDAIEYADPHSPEDISTKLIGLLTDTARLERFRLRGLDLSRKYSVGAQAAGYLASLNAMGKIRGESR